ncbi:MAG: hypothetical protein HKN47_26875 [Pirellulaceae bacterium]|nr:hypothetical protein [Pirellulaceae bacterium]
MSGDFDNSRPDDNPYEPSSDPSLAGMDKSIQLPEGQKRGMVGQTTVLGVLMIIQGIVNALAGVAIAGYAWFMPQVFQQMRADMAKQPAGGPPPPQLPENFELYLMIGGGILAAVMLLIGLLLVYSGLGVIRLQQRGLAIGSLCMGMLTILTCYCFPTSLALGIYGLILLLNQPVMLAFELRRQGYPVRRIQQAFMALP